MTWPRPLDRMSGSSRGLVAGVGVALLLVSAVLLVHAARTGERPMTPPGAAGGATAPLPSLPAPAPSAVAPASVPPTPGTPTSGTPAPGTPAPGTAAPLPDGTPVRCPAPTVVVAGQEQLTAALAAAGPGTSIRLQDGVYTGAFTATASGTAQAPIWLCGGPGAVLDGGGIRGGYVLHLQGAGFWRLVGFTVRNGQKGVVADATHASVLQGLTVHEIGDEGIHLRAGSTGNAVLACSVHTTGLRRDKFGEGVYVGSARSNWSRYSGGGPDRSDNNLVRGNTISATGAESVDVKEGTTGGAVVGNTFDGAGMTGADSWVDVKGNGYRIEGNTGRNSPQDGFQTHRILDGWGTGNTFRANTVLGGVPGLGIHLAPVLDNVVECAAGSPTSNVCPP